MWYEFENLKFEINNPEHSERIQKCLFELGYSWSSGYHKIIQHKDARYLFTYSDGLIFYSNSLTYDHPNKKSYLLDLQYKLEKLNPKGETNMQKELHRHFIQSLLSTLQSDLAKANCYITLQHDSIWLYCNDTDKELKCKDAEHLKDALAAKMKFIEQFKGE
jgi:hypothetical protein